eukprot:396417-Prorocentrum_minimum.AAC.2
MDPPPVANAPVLPEPPSGMDPPPVASFTPTPLFYPSETSPEPRSRPAALVAPACSLRPVFRVHTRVCSGCNPGCVTGVTGVFAGLTFGACSLRPVEAELLSIAANDRAENRTRQWRSGLTRA